MYTVTDETKISRLNNSICYVTEIVFILHLKKGCALIAINGGQVLLNELYNTERGAKIAFTRFFNKRKKVETKPDWTAPYPVDKDWLTPYLLLCGKQTFVQTIRKERP